MEVSNTFPQGSPWLNGMKRSGSPTATFVHGCNSHVPKLFLAEVIVQILKQTKNDFSFCSSSHSIIELIERVHNLYSRTNHAS